MNLFVIASLLSICFALPQGAVKIEGGKFLFGTSLPKDGGVSPPKAVSVVYVKFCEIYEIIRSFMLQSTLVSNLQFEDFVARSKYVTDSEKFGWSFVLEQLLDAETLEIADSGLGRVKDALHWVAVSSASWKHPEGPNSDLNNREEYPVTHISCNDAKAYCKSIGGRLPTEIEFEYAARAGTTASPVYWESFTSSHLCNTWQGQFPSENTLSDGFLGTSPVTAFPPNQYGLHDMIGNLWQWTSHRKCVLRGSSFIDTLSGEYNHAATVSSRQEQSDDSAAINTGFRCAYSIDSSKTKKDL